MENLNNKVEIISSKIQLLENKVSGLHGSARNVVMNRIAQLTTEYHVCMKNLCDGLGIGYFPK